MFAISYTNVTTPMPFGPGVSCKTSNIFRLVGLSSFSQNIRVELSKFYIGPKVYNFLRMSFIHSSVFSILVDLGILYMVQGINVIDKTMNREIKKIYDFSNFSSFENRYIVVITLKSKTWLVDRLRKVLFGQVLLYQTNKFCVIYCSDPFRSSFVGYNKLRVTNRGGRPGGWVITFRKGSSISITGRRLFYLNFTFNRLDFRHFYRFYMLLPG